MKLKTIVVKHNICYNMTMPRNNKNSLTDDVMRAVDDREAAHRRSQSSPNKDEERHRLIKRRAISLEPEYMGRIRQLADPMRSNAIEIASLLVSNGATPSRIEDGIEVAFWPVYELKLYESSTTTIPKKSLNWQDAEKGYNTGKTTYSTVPVGIIGIGLLPSGELVRTGKYKAWREAGSDPGATDLDLVSIGLIDMSDGRPPEYQLAKWQSYLKQLAAQELSPGAPAYTPQGSVTFKV